MPQRAFTFIAISWEVNHVSSNFDRRAYTHGYAYQKLTNMHSTQISWMSSNSAYHVTGMGSGKEGGHAISLEILN